MSGALKSAPACFFVSNHAEIPVIRLYQELQISALDINVKKWMIAFLGRGMRLGKKSGNLVVQ